MERRITVAAEDEPIENVLAQIFAGQDVSYEINGRSIVVTRRAVPRVAEKAVSRTLSGVVRDDQGRHDRGGDGRRQGDDHRRDDRHRWPLFAARVGGQSRVADFVRGLPDGRSAVAPAQTVVDVTLAASSIDVDEVVVVGYGTQSRHTLTTAVSKIAGSAVAAAPVTSVGDALKGKVAGMQVSTTNSLPGEAPTFLIRGGSSINQSNAPIVIVDGITRAMNDINPNDIESIEVLKDAAAAGIYGSRASNGVILITTKKGTVGKGPEIVFEGQIGWESPSRKWDFMNAEEFLSFVRPAIAESYNGRVGAHVGHGRRHGQRRRLDPYHALPGRRRGGSRRLAEHDRSGDGAHDRLHRYRRAGTLVPRRAVGEGLRGRDGRQREREIRRVGELCRRRPAWWR